MMGSIRTPRSRLQLVFPPVDVPCGDVESHNEAYNKVVISFRPSGHFVIKYDVMTWLYDSADDVTHVYGFGSWHTRVFIFLVLLIKSGVTEVVSEPRLTVGRSLARKWTC